MSINMENVFRIGKQGSVLPSGYTQLEYIQGTGTQYINTGINPNNNTKIIAYFKSTNTSVTEALIGGRNVSSGDSRNSFTIWENVTANMRFDYQSSSTNVGRISKTDWNYVVKDRRYNYLNNEQLTSNSEETYSCDYPLVINAVNTAGNIGNIGNTTFGIVEIYQDGTILSFKGIPAKRNSDNAIGMFDLVSQTFFANAGSGSFTAGPVVEVCKISQNNQTIWERAIPLTSNKDSEVTFRSTRNESKNLIDLSIFKSGYISSNAPEPVLSDYTITEPTMGSNHICLPFEVQANQPISIKYFVNKFNSIGYAIYENGVQVERNGATTALTITPAHSGKMYIWNGAVSDSTESQKNKIMVVKSSTAPTSYEPYWNTLPELNAYGNTAQPSAIKPYIKTAISTTPTTFNSELAGPLNVLADGKTEQRNIPVEYQELEYISSDSKAYIDTGIAGGKTTLEIGAKFSYSSFVAYGAIYGNYVSDFHQGVRCILAAGSNKIITNNETACTTNGNTELSCSINDVHTLISKNTEVTLDSVTTVITNKAQRTENSGNIALLNRSITNPNTSRDIDAKVYEFYIKDSDTLVRNLIPAKRLSDNVLGMYDTVSGQFFTNAGSGTFTAGPVKTPTPDAPMDLVCNNGVIKWDGSKIVTEGTQEKLVFANNCGVVDLGTLNWGKGSVAFYAPIPNVNPSTSAKYKQYVFTQVANNKAGSELNNMECSLMMSSSSAYAGDLFVRVDNYTIEQFKQLVSGKYLYYQRATDETWTAPQTVNVEMLNKIGDYTDVQDIVNGSVTKNVGVKVLDGTEDWNKISSNNIYYIVLSEMKTCNPPEKGISTHFVGTSEANASMPDYSVKNTYATAGDVQRGAVSIKINSITTVNNFKAFLADQYNAGTPVIVLYPLATPTTESVTAQPISQAVGTNIATISEGSITSLVGEVSGINQTQTTPTPESPLDIVSNNGVIKWDGSKIITEGIQEKITVNGKNLLDKNTETSAYLDEQGIPRSYSNFTCSDFIEIKPNTAYTFSGQDTSIRTDNGQRICFYDSSKTFISPRGGGEHRTIGNWSFTETSPNNAKYIRVSCGNCINIQLEIGSTATSYEPYHAPQSVLATMLNKIGTYQDIQNIVNGSVSKNVGVKVLDGTESWTLYSGTSGNQANISLENCKAGTTKADSKVTHFTYSENSIGNLPDGCYKLAPTATNCMFKYSTQLNTLADWKAWLASEYAKGTPVIIMYPLATPTTESVSSQEITINKGTYIAEITEASLADLDISVKYLGNE